jgi:hypothetical protein
MRKREIEGKKVNTNGKMKVEKKEIKKRKKRN